MVTALPTGLVSFLFTDVDGSTSLWESDPAGMAESLALHDQIVRSAAESHSGHVFSTAGDAFAVAFETSDDAVGAAVKIQLGLLHANWPGPAVMVRMGIHTGHAEERGGDYFGPVLNRGARIMSAGHGGQVLLSAVTAESIELTKGMSLVDLGTHHLKDIEEPEHVFRLEDGALPSITTPIRTVDVRRHNLPDFLTSFVGRSDVMTDVASSVGEKRLVVLTGVGGTGKTRLAIETARQAIDDFPDGAWVVELASLTNPAFIVTAIGELWGLRPGEGATIEEVVTRYLWPRNLLLVIDNCEHLIDGAAQAARLILDSCPDVRILATSREGLGIAGEKIVRVPSLGLPDRRRPLHESESVRLFVDRAASVRPDFDPDDSELAAISRICELIDGIPLGIELAAARLRAMSVVELADRLENSFRILSRSEKGAHERQRTMHATIGWSHDLLKPSEMSLFRRLSVFVGGFDLGAGEAVCSGVGVEDWEVIDLIDSLVDKSLVVVTEGPAHGTRYRLLEPVRQYGAERLEEEGEAGRTATAHALHFASFVAEASPYTRGPEQMAWERRIELEYDNIRLAFDTMLRTGEIDRHLTTGFHLFIYWMHVGMHVEGIDTLMAGLEAASENVDPLVRLKAWSVAAGLGAEITDPTSIEHARRGLELAETMDDPNALGHAELQLGAAINHSTTDPEYLEHLEKARRLLEANPEPYWWEPEWEKALLNLVLAAYLPPTDHRHREHLEVALELFEDVGDTALLAATLGDSAGLWGQGDDEWILGNLHRAAELLSEIEVPYWYGHVLMVLGALLERQGEHEEARQYLTEAVVHLGDCGDVNCWANTSRSLASAEAALGDPVGAGYRVAEVIEKMPILPMQEIHKPRTLDMAAKLLLANGQFGDSAVVLGRAEATELSVPLLYPREEMHVEIREGLVAALGDDEASQLMEKGKAMELDEALEHAGSRLREA